MIKHLSLRARLTVLFSIALMLAWLFASASAFFQLNNHLREVFDSQQLLFAKRLASLKLQDLLTKQPQTLPKIKSRQLKKLDVEDDALAFAIFSRDGLMLLSDGENGRDFIYPKEKLNSSERILLHDQHGWRILWLRSADNQFVIAVGQELDYRQELAFKIITQQMLPWAIMLPILLLITVIIISRELKPIKVIANTVRKRRPDDASPLDGSQAPTEVRPLIDALNTLFQRISSQLNRERRFTSDAAHELRTPLAALKIQTEVAQLSDDDPQGRQHALNNLIEGIDHATHLVEQLLTLSRLDSLSDLAELEVIDWSLLAHSLVQDMQPIANQHQTTLQLSIEGKPPQQMGQPLLLSMLIRNLIDNALRYCPDGSLVNVRLTTDGVCIEDNGSGLSQQMLNHLGERFFRPSGQNQRGSGLGISIVKQIAALHHLELDFANLPTGGLRVKLTCKKQS